VRTNLHFNGGVRFDQYGSFDPALDPRLALIYHPFQESTLKAIYGTAFRAPNFLELSDARFQDIKPEEITTYELVYEQEIGRDLRSSVSAYLNQMEDLIVLENGAFTNFDAETKGLELALQGFWTNGWRGLLSYACQKTENRSTGQGLPDSPVHLVKINVNAPLVRDKVFAGLEYQYASSRNTRRTTTTGDTLPGSDAGGHGLVNLTLFSQNIVSNLDFSVSTYNLLGSKYSDPATRFHLQDRIARDGRSFRLKLTYRF
jgi:outer membrane receptor for ferrienterochelin and colicins